VAGIGFLALAMGLAFMFTTPVAPKVLQIGRLVTFSWLSPAVRGVIFLGLGSLLFTLGTWRILQILNLSLLGAQRRPRELLIDIHRFRTRVSGPMIVAFGGGTGLSTVLRGLKHHTSNITAVVTVADDGGSSGRLRLDLSIPPPGDARNCLVALADDEVMLGELMQYRFSEGVGLEGHSLGNLLLAALTDLAGGFDEGLRAAAELLAINGVVIPSTLVGNVVLSGVTASGQVVEGESRFGELKESLHKVWLTPDHPPANPHVLDAILQADVIVIGPGSLYTSIIPNFLVDGISAALQKSRVPKILICNVATQPGETDGYGVRDHWREFEAHSGITITHLLVNSNVVDLPAAAVVPEDLPGFEGKLVMTDLIDSELKTRHDSGKLADAILELLDQLKAH
jgi:uncharacterized cofD-like protein